LALFGAVPVVTVTTAAPAQAASGCWGSGGAHTDYLGNTYGTMWCHAYHSGNVVAAGVVRGYLYAGDSWFVCQHQWLGRNNPPVGGAQNNWWLYTQGDTSTGDRYHGWGWFPATHISGGRNWEKIPGGLRDCDEIPGSPFPSP
jgi:hypothetical protein